ncbi:uncharacterized protein LOC110978803 [Acanthaster planci]|uniref:Uncharacterized protein LOC110978803 n=1 Tax=Acanthaster planci TaxID=133434 RepID=A0A8B7Y960_ACAPL|nr:uncharacterized protein LOC110978803 [Acanthaster planci]
MRSSLRVGRSSAQLYQTRNIAEADLIYEWTPWLSSSSPRDNPVGDNETLAHLLQVYPVDGCAYPVRIECRERYTMKTPEYLRDRVGVTIAHLCDLNEGLLCLNSDNAASAPCPDFEVRFICAGKRSKIITPFLFKA